MAYGFDGFRISEGGIQSGIPLHRQQGKRFSQPYSAELYCIVRPVYEAQDESWLSIEFTLGLFNMFA